MAFRIVQEALTNVVRHAKAKQVDVRLALRDGALELAVSDDGIGLPMDGRPERIRAHRHSRARGHAGR